MENISVLDRDDASHNITVSEEDHAAVAARKWYLPYTTNEIRLFESSGRGEMPVVKQRGSAEHADPLHVFIRKRVEEETNKPFPKRTHTRRKDGWRRHARHNLYVDSLGTTLLTYITGQEPVLEKSVEEYDALQKYIVEGFAEQIAIAYEDGNVDLALKLTKDATFVHPWLIFTILADFVAWT